MTAPLRYPAFRYLAGGRVVNMLGNAMAPIALAFAVLDLTGSPRDLGLVVGARSLTNVLFLLFGGVLADRVPRHLVLVVSNALAALTQATVATLVLTGTASIPVLMGLSAVNGLVASFSFPAAAALMAQTVPPEVRKQANGLARLGTNGAMIVGASTGGLLVASVGPGWGLAADALTFAVAGTLFSLVRVPGVRDHAKPKESTLTELRIGWREFVSHTWVWVVVLAFCFLNAAEVGAMQVLGPVVADASFGRRAWGLILAIQTLGMVAGAVLAMRLRVRRLLLVGCAAMIGEAPLLIALGVAPQVALLLPLAFVNGMCVEQFGIAWETSVQEHIPADKLARVYSYDALGSFIAIPIGQVIAGPVAIAIGVGPTLICAAGVITLGVIGMLLSRDVRRLEHHPVAVPPPAAVAPAETIAV